MAFLDAGQTPTEAQIEQLNKGELLKLIKARDLDIDPRGMPPEDLRAAVQAELAERTDANAEPAQSEDRERADTGEGVVEELAQALSSSVDEEQAQVETETQADTETETQADANARTGDDTTSGNLEELTRQDLDRMDRNALIEVIRRRDLAIEVQNTQTAELRTSVSRELGLMENSPEQRAEQTGDTLGDALEDAAEGAVDEIRQSLDIGESEREAETDRRRAEEDAAEGEPLAATTDAETDAEAEVTTRTVTEESSRSSDEEFETQLTTGAEATAGTQAQSDDDDGLSTLGKAAALGLGALALNEILGANDEVVTSSRDRVVVRQNGELRVLKNDDVHLQRPGNEVQTSTYKDGSTRTVITRADGSKVITVRAADGRVLRRVRERPDGTRVVIFDDTQQEYEPVNVRELPRPDERGVTYSRNDSAALESALRAELAADVDRRFSLRQVRNIRSVRKLMPPVTLDAVHFQTDSSVIRPREAEDLADLGRQMVDVINQNPDEVFLVEGHTDTVGNASYNLALSDRRAESVALALIEYFDVPPENLVIQGYGESDLAVAVRGPERANRRATVRRITPLLRRAER
ncbi:OmpA family protein [Salinihabitans flavidus]|nr:OmpA family protein [Salinihabitans flavidus]